MHTPVPHTLAIGRALVMVWRLSLRYSTCIWRGFVSRHNMCEDLIAFCMQTRVCYLVRRDKDQLIA